MRHCVYQVGQILFLVLHKKQQILPVQVVEEVVRTTLDGKEIDYTVSVPGKSGKSYSLDDIDASVFASLEEVKIHIETNIKQSIEKMISTALAVAEKEFNFKEELSTSKNDSIEDHLKEDNENYNVHESDKENKKLKVELSDGTVANFKI
jgi:hypothetical protein